MRIPKFLAQAVDKGVLEVSDTLNFITSEDFISHTCNAGEYVAHSLMSLGLHRVSDTRRVLITL